MSLDNPLKENVMKSPIALVCTTLLAAALSLPAYAQPGPGMGGGNAPSGMPGPGGPQAAQRAPRDCAKSPNPEHCKARQEARAQALEACKGKAGPERRTCMHDHMPPPDCAKARNPQRCEAMQKAHEACKDKAGPERRQCMGDAMKAK